jgi:pimeloyl-ACP methyl ester carboxylesterase
MQRQGGEMKMFRFIARTFLALMLASFAAPTLAGSAISNTSFVSLGGIEQWVNITGDNRDNPVLLVVHGGPGDVQWPQAEKYVPWEKSFTVVQWDQRGAGHTYGRNGEGTPEVNLNRIARDGVELADYLCRTLGKKKIIVLGHSWGSLVAVTMVQLKPELFAAYVGTGQVASWKKTANIQYDLLLAKARRDDDTVWLEQFAVHGKPDLTDPKQYFAATKNLRTLWPPSDQAWVQSLRDGYPALAAQYPKDAKDLDNGEIFSGKHLIADEVAANLPVTAPSIGTAFILIQGRDDIITPTKAAVTYFQKVRAPQKTLVLIPNAGHFAFMTARDAFMEALMAKVRPVAIVRGA